MEPYLPVPTGRCGSVPSAWAAGSRSGGRRWDDMAERETAFKRDEGQARDFRQARTSSQM